MGTTNDTATLLHHQGKREREGLTPLVLIKRVSSERGMEWAAADAARDQRRINNAAILIPMAGQTRQGPNNMLTHPKK